MDDTILTVTQLNQRSKQLLEQGFGSVRINGEISNWMKASSGHCYFTLKDEHAMVRCAFFRSQAARVKFAASNGQAVLVRAQVSLYPNRGDYQLIVSAMEPAGLGQLAILFAKLKAKLQKAGLFDEKHKKPLPALPKRIGVITSPTGAALADIKKVLGRRFPLAPVTVYASLVQGTQAPSALLQALQQAIADNRCDVLILARGGGSMEDLWGFNDEALAHAIHNCPIPLISGVGHEVDFTIADFVADLRAATPSAAAEHAVPHQQEVLTQIESLSRRLQQQTKQLITQQQARLKTLQSRLIHPKQLLQNQMQRLDFVEARLHKAISNQVNNAHQRSDKLNLRLRSIALGKRIDHTHAQLLGARKNLTHTLKQHLQRAEQTLARLAASLEQQSPLKLLARGYSVLSDKDNRVVRSVREIQTGAELTATLADGRLTLRVESTQDQTDKPCDVGSPV